MKNILILITIVLLTSCLKNVDKPEGELVKMGFALKNFTISATTLKAGDTDPFSIVEQTTPYGEGTFNLINRNGETKTISFLENGLDTVQTTIKEGDWKLENHYFYDLNKTYHTFHSYANPYMFVYIFAEYVRNGYDWPDINDGYQHIDNETPNFELAYFPKMDCIAIYDTIDMLNSTIYMDDNQETILLTKEQMVNYDNGVNVYYSDSQAMTHRIKLNNGRILSIDMGDIRDNIEHDARYLYIGPENSTRRFYKPLFVKIKLLPGTNVTPTESMSVSIRTIKYNDTITINF